MTPPALLPAPMGQPPAAASIPAVWQGARACTRVLGPCTVTHNQDIPPCAVGLESVIQCGSKSVVQMGSKITRTLSRSPGFGTAERATCMANC
jgi:hypothetical protein